MLLLLAFLIIFAVSFCFFSTMLSLEDYFRNSQNSAYRISPDGQYISFLAPYKDRMNICVRRILPPDAVTAELHLGETLRLTQETDNKKQVQVY